MARLISVNFWLYTLYIMKVCTNNLIKLCFWLKKKALLGVSERMHDIKLALADIKLKNKAGDFHDCWFVGFM